MLSYGIGSGLELAATAQMLCRRYAAGAAMLYLRRIAPGILACGAVGAAAWALGLAETRLAGRAWLEPLVLAILLGTAWRSVWAPGRAWHPGIAFSAKILLEVAVVLLGAALSLRAVAQAGPALLGGIAGVVLCAIAASYGLGRALGLPHKMATLVACGNAICGNSAIAAIAPVIDAHGDDVAASIAFTAVLGVAVILLLPLAGLLLHLTGLQYGTFAGLTVYAVPQVLAAAAPAGQIAVQFGTLVKLTRVMMLGPIVLALSVLTRRQGTAPRAPRAARAAGPALVPWFIIGFVALAAARATGWIPDNVLAPAASLANVLTVLSMAALGLSTDVRAVARSGLGVAVTVTVSLMILAALGLGLIYVSGI